MTCANCAALRAKVERLEREVKVVRAAGDIQMVMQRLGTTAPQTRWLLRLYEAGGRALSTATLAAEVSYGSERDMKSYVFRIRAQVGEGFVENVKGVGYRLTPEGLSRIMAALEPVEMQDARCI